MRMNHLFKVFVSLVLLVWAPVALSLSIEVPEEELQQKLSAAMPFEIKKYLITVIISDPKIQLGTDVDEIHVASKVNVIAPGGKSGSGSLRIKGPILYDPGTVSFFLKDPVVEELSVDNLVASYSEPVKQVVQALITRTFAKYPIYTISGEGFKNAIAKSFLKSVSIENSKLILLF